MTTTRKDTPMPDDNQRLNRPVKTPDTCTTTLVRPWFVLVRHDEPANPPVDYRTATREEFATELARYGVKPTHESAGSGPITTLADELAQYGLTTRPTR